MYSRRTHVMKALTERTRKGWKFKWTSEMDAAFTTIKYLVSKDTLLVYPRYRKEFTVLTDLSDYQLGGFVSQEGRPIALFSRKINTAQKKCTATEKELLGITKK